MMSSPSQSIKEEKENTHNKLQQWNPKKIDWRKPASNRRSSTRSYGIDPKQFHREAIATKHGQKAVQELHVSIQKNIVQDEKRKVGEDQAMKRSAFTQVSELRVWPTQEQAFRHWRKLMMIHMHEDPSEPSTRFDYINPLEMSALATEDSSGKSSSTATSLEQEPKRMMRDLSMSPSKSSTKAQYRREFLAEQALREPLPLDHHFGSPLWSMEPRIFSTEKSTSGKRKYVVGNLGRFLDMYWRKADRCHRHYYELIREKTPCRLYLDLEYSKISNPNISQDDAEGLLDELLQEISKELVEVYQIEAIGREHVVDLESSTDKKFSRHWIFHLPGGRLFAHTAAVGQFMQNLVGRLAESQAVGTLEAERPLLHKYLFVKSAPSDVSPDLKQTCFIDMGVYTRNRLFRLLGSSKFGKPAAAALRIAEKNQFQFEGFGNESFYVPAMEEELALRSQQSSDVTDGGSHSQESDDVDAVVQNFKTLTDWSLHAEALAQTLVVPVNGSKINFPMLPYSESTEATKVMGKASVERMPVGTFSTELSFGKSPYPMLDSYVLSTLAVRGGVQGAIRAWSIDYDYTCVDGTKDKNNSSAPPKQITYQMSRNRWCECVRRPHKSNNIMWTVDLRMCHCYQTCHDPECRAMQFRGTPVDLPSNVREALQEALFEEGLARLIVDEPRERTHEDKEGEKARHHDPSDFDDSKDNSDKDDAAFELALAELCLEPTMAAGRRDGTINGHC